MLINIILLLTIILSNLNNVYLANIFCDKRTDKEMDNSIAKMIVVGQKDLKFPTNARELRIYCNHALKTVVMMKDYSNQCLPKLGSVTSKAILHTIGTELKGICRTGRLSKKARELLEAAPCANDGLDNWKRCYDVLVDKFTGTVIAPSKYRVPMGCCNFHQLINCMLDEAEEVKKCSRKTVDYVMKYMHKVIDPFLYILCNEYSEPSDRCDVMVMLTPNSTVDQTRYKSFLMPVINIAVSLGENID